MRSAFVYRGGDRAPSGRRGEDALLKDHRPHAAQTTSAAAEWRAHWPLVLAAGVGISFNSLFAYTLGVFMEPLTKAFGWTRSEVTAGMIIPAIIAVPMSPIVGGFVDRWGSRRLAVPGLLIGALILAGFGLANGSMTQWLFLWFLVGSFGLMIKSTVWTVAVSATFTQARGLALGITLCGVALAQVIGPPLSEWLIRSFGWREAYFGLAAGWGGLALILSVFFLFDAADVRRREAAVSPKPAVTLPDQPGLTLREAVRDAAIWKIAISTLLILLLTGGLLVHLVPILTEIGVSRPRAALLASLSGVAGLVGKVVAGYLSDRWNARFVGAITMTAPAIGYACLLEPVRNETLVIVSMLLLGYTSGVKIQICAYLTSRYAGMRAFGAIFGIMSSIITVGTSVGPAIFSAAYDILGSYEPLFLASLPFFPLCAWLILSLGPYPSWKAAEPESGAAEPKPSTV